MRKTNKLKFKFNIPNSEIRQDNKNKERNIHKDLDFEKQIQILKEEKTTTDNYFAKKNNLDTVNKDKFGENKESEINCGPNSKESENNIPFPNIDIDIDKIREENENKIQEKMKLIKDNLTEEEKRNRVLMELKTTKIHLDKKQEDCDKIDIRLIKEKEEIEINKKIKEINSNESYYEKRLLVLNEKSTKKDYMNKEEIKPSDEVLQNNDSKILNEETISLENTSCSNLANDSSTFQDSKENNTQFIEDKKENKTKKSQLYKQFNEARTRYHLKYKLFDSLIIEGNDDLILPERYILDETHFVFVYQDNLMTYPISQTELLNRTKTIIKIKNKEEPFGLHFCGNKINIDGEKGIRECAPNNFICKECMEKNKKRYNLPKDYLINIKGRISIKKDDIYHCFGTFEDSKNFKYCMKAFTCEACKVLNLCKNYYFA